MNKCKKIFETGMFFKDGFGIFTLIKKLNDNTWLIKDILVIDKNYKKDSENILREDILIGCEYLGADLKKDMIDILYTTDEKLNNKEDAVSS